MRFISYKDMGRNHIPALDCLCKMVFMTLPRSQLIDRENGGFHHVVMRCVRRAWLCGKDPLTGRDYTHRKRWIEDRLLKLSKMFAVRIHAYAIMSNHYHIELEYCPQEVRGLSSEEVARRWLQAYPPKRGDHFEASLAALLEDPERIEILRDRLGDLSWYMRCLNWAIARRANQEDGCTGKFWESRFYSSRPLETLEAVEACMVYVDLNPQKAGAVRNVAGEGVCTSLRRRLQEAERDSGKMDAPLAPMTISKSGVIGTEKPTRLPLKLRSYMAYVQWIARRDSLDDPRRVQVPLGADTAPRGISEEFLIALAGLNRRWGRQEGVGDTPLSGRRAPESFAA